MINKRKKGQLGFSANEFLSVIGIATVLIAIVLGIAVQVSSDEKFRAMRYSATLFGFNSGEFSVSGVGNRLYLYELVETGLFPQVKNPFGNPEYCDNYESRVDFDAGKKYITLKCGDYLIDRQYIDDDRYQIYKVSAWSSKEKKETKQVKVQHQTVYNYRKKEKEQLDRYYVEEIFVSLFNRNHDTSYRSVMDISRDYEVVKKEQYRTLVKVNNPENEDKGKE